MTQWLGEVATRLKIKCKVVESKGSSNRGLIGGFRPRSPTSFCFWWPVASFGVVKVAEIYIADVVAMSLLLWY